MQLAATKGSGTLAASFKQHRMERKEKILGITINPKEADIRNSDKQNINEFNIQEIRGWVIDNLNLIDTQLDYIITEFFNPSKKSEFRNIILNSSVVSAGAKMKIIKNINSFDNAIISKLQRLISIRNAFAHIPVTNATSIKLKNEDGELKMSIESITAQLSVMNSSGEIKTSNVKDLIAEFEKLLKEINNQLEKIIFDIQKPADSSGL